MDSHSNSPQKIEPKKFGIDYQVGGIFIQGAFRI
jgi:hypothetical protein